jgi:pantoate--beta-alanine ligase
VSAPAAPQVIVEPTEMTAWAAEIRARGERIAFVPTMGALHAGHVALLEEGRRRGDRLVLSIFVNPTQFGPSEDLARYPRDWAGDLAKAAAAGVDVVFAPEPATMYPSGFQTYIEVREISRGLCGKSRPGHFLGVATVVAKLFHLVQPHLALFGEKDYQQLLVIRRMVADLAFPVEIVALPTVREEDGLAMSSRNAYLSPADRRRAAALWRALTAIRSATFDGERRVHVLAEQAASDLAREVDRIEYLEIRDAETLEPLRKLNRPAVILVAAFVGGTRLIDNLRL